MQKNSKKYSLKDLGIDILWVLGALCIHFLYGGISEIIGIPFNKWVTFAIAITLWIIINSKRPFAGLYYAIINLNIVLIAGSILRIWFPESKPSKFLFGKPK